ncbi:ribonuclease [Sphingomonas cavernae]|uniref:Ribonuclease n=1 Tax=Sphingomonas cavernae TaxID=2320861 RepID=A0A418WQE7_9SPHN|nr:ribonuclease [Sphingomonas cavernae]RJF93472.1 ribonuclease [Sphingomonas cavernae]
MAEWLFEQGIGETRAALVDDDDTILEARIERDSELVRAGAVVRARLTRQLIPGRRAIITLDGGEEALLEPIPAGVTEGATLTVEILRGRIPEPGRAKLAKARGMPDETPLVAGPNLQKRIAATGIPVRTLSINGLDLLEAAGWSELLEEAESGEAAFPGGNLRLSLTPAMALIDVDGTLPPEQLAIAGAAAAGRMIRRFGLGGSIGIDLPTVAGKAERIAAAAALDGTLPQPFERTAVNGFGFLQIIRRRTQAAIPELLQGDRALAAALALLRRAERATGHGARTVTAAPQVIARIESQSAWIAALERRLGAQLVLRADATLAISAGHVSSEHP